MSLLPRLPEAGAARWPGRLLVALTCLAGFCAFYRPIWDGDSYWHLAVGREMWTTHHLLRTDTFSFTEPGRPWYNFGWLFQIFAYLLWSLGGEVLLVAATAAAGAAVLALMYRNVRQSGGRATHFAFIALLALPLFAERVRLRPELCSLLLIPCLLEVLLRWDRPSGLPLGRACVAVGALFFVWAQCHAGWVFGLVVIAAFAAGRTFDRLVRRESPREQVRGGLALAAVALVCLLANPTGWRALWVPVAHLLEFTRPDKIPLEEWQRTPWSGYYLGFGLTSVAFAIYVLLSKRSDWTERFLVGSQVLLALLWVRYPPFAVLAASPVLVRRLAAWTARPVLMRATSALCVFLLGVAVWTRAPHARAMDDLSASYPIQEVAFLKANQISGNVLATLPAENYLDWAYYPLGRVAFDGRFFPFIEVLRQYREAHRSFAAYRAFLNAWPVTLAIYAQPEPGAIQRDVEGRPLPRGPSFYVYPPKEWALVYFGNYGMVFLRHIPQNEAWIASSEFTLLRPDEMERLREGALPLPPDRSALAREIERKLQDPAPYVYRGQLFRLKEQLAGAVR